MKTRQRIVLQLNCPILLLNVSTYDASQKVSGTLCTLKRFLSAIPTWLSVDTGRAVMIIGAVYLLFLPASTACDCCGEMAPLACLVPPFFFLREKGCKWVNVSVWGPPLDSHLEIHLHGRGLPFSIWLSGLSKSMEALEGQKGVRTCYILVLHK